MPSGSARVCTSAMVWGKQRSEMKKTLAFELRGMERWQSVIASAAAQRADDEDDYDYEPDHYEPW